MSLDSKQENSPITIEVKNSLDKGVLCWLATVDRNNIPNVTPKEIFVHYGDKTLLIANIASPNSVKNIISNPQLCASIVDIFAQKGFKLKGLARIISNEDRLFNEYWLALNTRHGNKFPIKSIIEVTVNRVEKIIAPSYFLFKETTEESQIESAMKTYGVRPL